MNSVKNTEAKTELNKTGYEHKEPDVEVKPDEKTDDTETTLDDMYGKPDEEKKPEGEETKEKEEEKKPDEKTDEEQIKDPATGYNKPEDEEKKPDEKDEEPADDKDEKKPEAEIKEALKNLPENLSKEEVLKFAVDNKMSKEQVEAYVKLTNDTEKTNQEAQVKAVEETRKQWNEELFTDRDFGGENGVDFDKNVHNVEKLLENNMPNIKKALTDRGGVLPPYTMKDFLGIYKLLHPKTELDSGDPGEVEPKEGNFLDVMYK